MHVRTATRGAVALSAAIGALSVQLPDPSDPVVDGLWRSAAQDGAVTIDPAYAEQDRLEVDALYRSPDIVKAEPYFPPEWRALMMQAGDESFPRKMWLFWENGTNGTLPSLNDISIRQWRHLNPDWKQTVLNCTGVSKMFPELAQLFKKIPRTVQLRSDMLRLWLLAEHGGVWLDASALPLKPLDSFVTKLVRPAGFWTFHFPPARNGHVTTWFMAAQPRNRLVLRWRDAFMEKWKEPGYVFAYFELHHTLEDLVQALDQEPAVKTVWKRMPKVTESWPQACLRGCSDYWNVTKPEDRTPVLKRPFQKQKKIPSQWWAGYWDYMDRYQSALRKSPAVMSDFWQVAVNNSRRVVGNSSRVAQNTSSRAATTAKPTRAPSPDRKWLRHPRVKNGSWRAAWNKSRVVGNSSRVAPNTSSRAETPLHPTRAPSAGRNWSRHLRVPKKWRK